MISGYDINPLIIKNCLIQYRHEFLTNISIGGNSPTIQIIKDELKTGPGRIGWAKDPIICHRRIRQACIIATGQKNEKLGQEGFSIKSGIANGKQIFALLQIQILGCCMECFICCDWLQTQQPISKLNIISTPKLKLRILNHWDNLNRTVERGYAGFSIWNWHTLPDYIDQRYIDYARANASIGINGTVLNKCKCQCYDTHESHGWKK